MMTYLPTLAIGVSVSLFSYALIGFGQTVIPVPPELQWAGSLGVGGFVAWWSLRLIDRQATATREQLAAQDSSHKQQQKERDDTHAAQLLTIITQNGLREERGIAAQEKTADAILKFTATIEKFATLERVMQVVERRRDENPPQSSGDRRQPG